ncbi:MAG: NAD(P)/FAD-dependent oxidoreductase [Rhodomicrobium sp.]
MTVNRIVNLAAIQALTADQLAIQECIVVSAQRFTPQLDSNANQVHKSAHPGRAKVVIVGAGFGGLSAAYALRNAPVDITILDRHNYHCFQPLLYQVATAALSPADIAWPIRRLFRSRPNVTVLLAEVTGVDPRAGTVFAGLEAFPFDYLVLASGATHSYFGHPDWAAVAPGLKTIEDATLIRRNMLLGFEKAELAHTTEERRRFLTFAIVGGGPTGVEMAGAIASIARESLRMDFRHINPEDADVILIEAGPRILPALPENLSGYAHRALTRMGVDVRTSTAVTACTEAGVDTEKGFIEAGTVIWAAGVVASPAAKWLGVKADRAGRMEVNADLSLPNYSNIFAIGDTALVRGPDNKPVPGIAPAAKQMGDYAGKRIAAIIAGKEIKAFRYHHEGDLATIGRDAAVVKIGSISLTGRIGWLFWGAAHIYFLIGLRNRFAVAFSWLWSYLTYQQGARLITGYDPRADEDGQYAKAAGATVHKSLGKSASGGNPPAEPLPRH